MTLRHHHPRGTALIMALMYVTLFGILATSMVLLSQTSVRLSYTEGQTVQAYAAAESGLNFLVYQLKLMPKPIVVDGVITPTLATTLWSQSGTGIAASIATQLNNTGNLQGKSVVISGNTVQIPTIKLVSTSDPASFQLTVTQDTVNPTILHLTSVGKCGEIIRAVTMDVLLEKRFKYAVYSSVAIQIGKNAVVDGDMASSFSSFSKGPPVWTLADFRALSNMSSLDTDLVNFRAYIASKDLTYSNRLDVRTSAAAADATAHGFKDCNGDGFIDDYDLLLNRLDANKDKRITSSEFLDPSTGQSRDAELWTLLDTLNPPLESGGSPRAGYNDGVISDLDGYAKVKGSVSVAVTQQDWDTWAKSSSGNKYGTGFREQFQGPVISTDATVVPVQFGLKVQDRAHPEIPYDLPQLLPSDFIDATNEYKSKLSYVQPVSNPKAIAQNTTVQDVVLDPAMANSGTVVEQTPYGSTSFQAQYQRPVFKNVTFKNVRIPKGLNARFENCTFQGTTYVELNVPTTVTSQTQGKTWSQTLDGNKSFSDNDANTILASATSKTNTKLKTSDAFREGNNLHFESCTFQGPIASDTPTAYTHFSNSWEFTGATLFDNQVDPTATILAPQTNIEMGSFSNPSSAPSTLVGVVVAGNIDIRGRSVIDGSVIVVGDGAGNTTLGYFGPSDSDSNPQPMISDGAGYGRLYMRYNPARAMPRGIRIPISLTNQIDTYASATSYSWRP